MSIVSSTYTQDAHSQVGGGKYVIEQHTDSEGKVYQVGPYVVPDGFDMNARLAARASQLSAQLADEEAAQVLGQD